MGVPIPRPGERPWLFVKNTINLVQMCISYKVVCFIALVNDKTFRTWTIYSDSEHIRQLRLLTHVGFFSKTWSDTFKSVLKVEWVKNLENQFHNRAKKIHLLEKV